LQASVAETLLCRVGDSKPRVLDAARRMFDCLPSEHTQDAGDKTVFWMGLVSL
jgi:hypothetical protein